MACWLKENDSAFHNSIKYSWCLLHLLIVLVWELHWVLILLSSFQLHLSCHVWFNLFVFESVFAFSFVHLILDTSLGSFCVPSSFVSLVSWLSFLAILWVCHSIFHLMLSNSSVWAFIVFLICTLTQYVDLHLVLFWILHSHCFDNPCRWCKTH